MPSFISYKKKKKKSALLKIAAQIFEVEDFYGFRAFQAHFLLKIFFINKNVDVIYSKLVRKFKLFPASKKIKNFSGYKNLKISVNNWKCWLLDR